MADTVRYLMEEMIPELEDLEKKGYFSRAEVKAIAQKRQDFEYSLKRRAALKRDFLRYIDYELKVEELRRHRRKARGIKAKKGLAEVGILRRVHFIYERATRKFKADLSLWLDWIAFCKRTKSNKQFSKVVTKALHRHSHVGALWTEAAAWEFEHTGNAAAARALMQRGLRNCPQDDQLWAEYLRLELLYVSRLRARRQVLGLPVPEDEPAAAGAQQQQQQQQASPAAPQPSDARGRRRRAQPAAPEPPEPAGAAAAKAQGGAHAQDIEEPDADVLALAEERAEQGVAAAAASGEQGGGGASDAAVRAVLTGAVAGVVARAAVAAAPASLPLRRRLLRVLRGFGFPGVRRLRDALYEGVARDFAASPDAWDVLARRHWAEEEEGADEAPSTPPPALVSGTPQGDGGVDGGVEPAAGWTAEQRRQHAACLAVYERALASPAAGLRLHELRARYLGQRCLPLLLAASAPALQADGEGAAAAPPPPPPEVVEGLAEVGAQLLASYQAALDAKQASEALCAAHVDWALALSQPRAAARAARAACALHPRSPAVWLRRVRLELQLHARGLRSEQELCDALSSAVSSAGLGDGRDEDGVAALWAAAFDALPPGREPGHAALRRRLLAALAARGARGPARGGALAGVVAALVRATAAARGAGAARELAAELLRLPPAGGEVFHAMLDVELGTAPADDAGGQQATKAAAGKGGEARVRQLFEAAVAAYGREDAEVWLRYARWERRALRRGGGSVCWRAGKELDDPDGFMARYQEELRREAQQGPGDADNAEDADME